MNAETTYTFGEAGLINKPSLIVIIFAMCFSFWLVDFWKPINVYNGDSVFNNNEVVQYYSYLPSIFLNQSSFERPGKNVITKSVGQLNNPVPKYNYGIAALYFPFFMLAEILVDGSDTSLPGFSQTHASCLHWGAIFYVLLGLFFLRKFLLVYFNETVTAVSLFFCLFGTSLFYYTFSQSELPQSHLFFLFSLFLLLTQRWHRKPSILKSVLCGATLALIGLVYYFEIYVVLLFLFWNVKGRDTLKTKLVFFNVHIKFLVLILIVFVAFWIPQLAFNYLHTGWLIYDPSPGEKHNFADAKMYYLMFNYKQGWINYTPLIFFSLVGIFFIPKSFPVPSFVFITCVILMLVIYSSWWDLGHGPYFGARRLCSSIAWLSIPFAFIADKVLYPTEINLRRGILKLVFVLIVFSGTCFNIGQSYLVLQKRIVPDKTTEKSYWETFRTFKFKD